MQNATYDFMYDQELDHWWYRGRRKLVHLLFSRYVFSDSKKKLKILDVGCGAGVLMGELNRYGDIYGIDVSPLAVEYCKKRGFQNVTVDDLTNLAFSDGSFDVVIALDVLEHIEDDAQALREIKRVLTHDGIAIIFVPAFMSLWGEADEMGKHFRRYRRTQITSLIDAVELKVVRASYFNTILFAPIFVVRFLARKFGVMQKQEFAEQNHLLNGVFAYLFSFEIRMLSFLSFPFGVSFFTVIRK